MEKLLTASILQVLVLGIRPQSRYLTLDAAWLSLRVLGSWI